MKFAHEFREALLKEGYPQFWVDTAVPYGQLKKCLKKIQYELQEMGLEPETLRQLLATRAISPQGQTVPVAKYKMSASEPRTVRPRLVVVVQLDGGVAVDASLSPSSKEALKRLAAGSRRGSESQAQERLGGGSSDRVDSTAGARNDLLPPPEHHEDGSPAVSNSPLLERIEVPLVFDGEFFDLLQTDLAALESLQRQEEEAMTGEIVSLRRDISTATKPSRLSKTDVAVWRHLFELYLDAQVFFSTHEQDHGARTSAKALTQLIWFQDQVQARQLPTRFRVPGSHSAYSRFLALNATILKRLKFQEINQKAVAKILKKFDKRTSLGASVSFPAAMPSDGFMADSAAKKICTQVSQELVSVVPRVEDYSCPVCMSIAWLPVRLACHHVFCVRCVIKMQRDRKKQCPLCRSEVIMDADLSNLDKNLEQFLARYFKEETREKQRANEIERGIEVFGESYKHSSCSVM